MAQNFSKLLAGVIINKCEEAWGRAIAGRWGNNFVLRAHSDLNRKWYEMERLKSVDKIVERGVAKV